MRTYEIKILTVNKSTEIHKVTAPDLVNAIWQVMKDKPNKTEFVGAIWY